jgi:phosphate transport system ATP-binding protein
MVTRSHLTVVGEQDQLQEVAPSHGWAFEIEDLIVRYGQKQVLRVPRLTCPSRGVTSLLGPSGCGKSSLIKVLANLLDPHLTYVGTIRDFGEIRHDGAQPDGDTRYSMVWQTPIVFPCSIYDNLKIPLKKRGIPKQQWRGLIEEKLDAVGLLNELGIHWDRKNAENVSGGQKQRLCIARCLLQDSPAILLDEPSSSLDPVSTERIEEVITSLGRERPVLLVTHNLGQARRVSSYAAVFCVDTNGGYVCEYGPAQTCLHEPTTQDGRRFIVREVGH